MLQIIEACDATLPGSFLLDGTGHDVYEAASLSETLGFFLMGETGIVV